MRRLSDAGKLELFGRLRAENYRFLIAEQHRICFGGPARVEDGGRPETMIIVAEAADLTEAESWIAREPYNAAGGFREVRVRPWSQVLPEDAPGTLQTTLDSARVND